MRSVLMRPELIKSLGMYDSKINPPERPARKALVHLREWSAPARCEVGYRENLESIISIQDASTTNRYR